MRRTSFLTYESYLIKRLEAKIPANERQDANKLLFSLLNFSKQTVLDHETWSPRNNSQCGSHIISKFMKI